MQPETTEAVRQAGNLKNIFDRHRILLDNLPQNRNGIYRFTADILSREFDHDISKIIHYIQVKLDWPLSYKRLLLHHVRKDGSDNHDRLNNIAKFVSDPAANIKQRRRRFHIPIPSIISVERQYGSGVGSILHLQHGFFLINLLTLVLWISLVTIPYKILTPSSSFSNITFSFSSIFTSKDYLSKSILFQGTYPDGILDNKYNLSLIYFLTTYIYFFIWFIFITLRFSSTYKQKVFNSILNTKLGISFMCTFARWDYTINSTKDKEKQMKNIQRQYLDFIENDERIKNKQFNQYKTFSYKFKIIITNLFYIVLAVTLGGINWMILTFCNKPNVDCHGSIIYLALVNRIMPYLIVVLTQIEEYKYLSYKLDVVGSRCVLINVATILSFTIHFFLHAPSCYETAYGQYIYLLSLSDIFASLVFPILFGLFFDLLSGEKHRDFDGINLHVQLSPPALLYSQFLIWIGIYFSPLSPIMILINIIFSFLSHRLYFYIHSRRSDSYKRVFIWNAYRLEYLIYLLGYIVLIVSATSFAVFTTQIKPSENCGPFRHLNSSSEVVWTFLNDNYSSVLWISILNFLTSPGLIYFLGITFFIVAYKLRQEGLAEKQLVFIRENNFERKKHLRQNAVKKLHRKQMKEEIIRNSYKSESTDIDDGITRDRF